MPVSFTSNAKEFAADLDQLAEELGVETDVVIEKVTLDIWGRLIELTPVDTGRARAGWRVSNVARSSHIPPPGNYGRPSSPGQFRSASVLYIVNGLPYIARLNDGWSKKAPAGFVEMAVAEALASVDVELERLLFQREG